MNEDVESKRRRVLSSSNKDECTFHRLLQWMRARDCVVSEFIQFNDETRELYVNSYITKGTIVIKLSKHVIISRQSLIPKLFYDIATNVFPNQTKDSNRFQTFQQQLCEYQEDIALALYLASEVEEIKPYLDILPQTFDPNLPMAWNSKERIKRLCGSPVLTKIEEDEKQLLEYYHHISTYLMTHKQLGTIPSKTVFSIALAWVQSRAFGMDGVIRTDAGDAVPAMLPLLDLCNHARGKTVSKNLCYSYQDGCVIVKAVKDLCPGEVLRITYGALPNSQLLRHYGFCLDENIEPDGSSNDTLYFEPIPGRSVGIFLQMGPKSYTYGKLTQAMDYFYPERDQDSKNGEEDVVGPSLEEYEEFDDNDDDGLYTSYLASSDVSTDDRKNSIEDDRITEINALRKFEARLLDLLQAYQLGDSMNDLISGQFGKRMESCVQDQFASILIRSEVRTLIFFLHAVCRILTRLGVEPTKSKYHYKYNEQTVKEQIDDLVDVYMHIRHPDLITLQ